MSDVNGLFILNSRFILFKENMLYGIIILFISNYKLNI